eukprot:PhF_6_TR6988/c2_g1_i1/m.10354
MYTDDKDSGMPTFMPAFNPHNLSQFSGGVVGLQQPAPMAQQQPSQPQELFNIASLMMEESRQYNERMAQHALSMRNVAEPYRQLVAQLVQERDDLRQQLMQIQRVVSRYASVQEPVVASDGFTYEKRVLQQYLDDCKQAGQQAISQQTKEVLQETLYPNESLKKFVELLKELKIPNQTNVSVPLPFPGEEEAKPAVEEKPEPTTYQQPQSNQSNQQQRSSKREDSGSNNKASNNNGSGSQPSRHPCVRIYGLCNFGDDCVYAQYPYESCLNYLKGKCRFGSRCQEAHVDVQTGGSGNNNNNFQQGNNYQQGGGNNNNNGGNQQPQGYRKGGGNRGWNK